MKYSFIIDGVTLNSRLIAKKETEYSFEELIMEISKIVLDPISVEIMSHEFSDIVEETKHISRISPKIVIKVPMTMEGLKATKRLSEMNIKTNVTLFFSANQVLLAANCGATYASLFVVRLDDIGHNGIEIDNDTLDIFTLHNYSTQVITASIRNLMYVLSAAKVGAHVVTIPFNVIEKIFSYPLTDAGLNNFLSDWKKVPT